MPLNELIRFAWMLALTGAMATAQSELPDAQFVTVRDTFQETGLTRSEIRQIIAEVAKTSFDTPDSWERELRAHRVPWTGSEVLVVRGTELLCGGTGNCQVWVFVRAKKQWNPAFEQEAPIASGLAFEDQTNKGLNNLLLVTNLGGDKDRYTRYRFDGKFYRAEECFEGEPSNDSSAVTKVTQVRCE